MAILDWYSRRVFSWRASNVLTTGFCLDAVRETIARYGRPEIFNIDQGNQSSNSEFTELLEEHDFQTSMTARDAYMTMFLSSG